MKRGWTSRTHFILLVRKALIWMLTFDKKFVNKARELATNTSVELAG